MNLLMWTWQTCVQITDDERIDWGITNAPNLCWEPLIETEDCCWSSSMEIDRSLFWEGARSTGWWLPFVIHTRIACLKEGTGVYYFILQWGNIEWQEGKVDWQDGKVGVRVDTRRRKMGSVFIIRLGSLERIIPWIKFHGRAYIRIEAWEWHEWVSAWDGPGWGLRIFIG